MQVFHPKDYAAAAAVTLPPSLPAIVAAHVYNEEERFEVVKGILRLYDFSQKVDVSKLDSKFRKQPLHWRSHEQDYPWHCMFIEKDKRCVSGLDRGDKRISPMKSFIDIKQRLSTDGICQSCMLHYGKGVEIPMLLSEWRPPNAYLFVKYSNTREDTLNVFKPISKKWEDGEYSLETAIPLYFTRVIPVDSKYAFLVGGSQDLDFKAHSQRVEDDIDWISLVDLGGTECKVVKSWDKPLYRY